MSPWRALSRWRPLRVAGCGGAHRLPSGAGARLGMHRMPDAGVPGGGRGGAFLGRSDLGGRASPQTCPEQESGAFRVQILLSDPREGRRGGGRAVEGRFAGRIPSGCPRGSIWAPGVSIGPRLCSKPARCTWGGVVLGGTQGEGQRLCSKLTSPFMSPLFWAWSLGTLPPP